MGFIKMKSQYSTMKCGENVRFGENRGGTKLSDNLEICIS